jgi:hypothetical protein
VGRNSRRSLSDEETDPTGTKLSKSGPDRIHILEASRERAGRAKRTVRLPRRAALANVKVVAPGRP